MARALAHDDHIDKRSLVSRLFGGRDVDSEQFGGRLSNSLAQLSGSAAPLIVFAGPATLWVWRGKAA
ncbi:hypothetical protein ACIPZ8_22835 [Pseudomonas sp. NPDC089422]|uniref:hypothetical protein n=1 Tax=Pseudomonas sp. NPDC089422 TaxID=3364466 RepID=UPI00380D39FA